MKKFLLWLFPLLVFLAGVGLTVFNYTQQKDNIEYLQGFKPTTGVLEEKRVVIDSNGKYDVTFSYGVDGKLYTQTIRTYIRHNGRHKLRYYHPGDFITLWYDPADPTVIKTGKPSPWLEICIPMIVAMTIVILYCFALVRVKLNKKKKSKDGHHRDRDDDDDDDDD